MTDIVVASFWVHRPKDFPNAHNYLDMLLVLDRSCQRWGYRHVVLTDWTTAPMVDRAGLKSYACGLERNLMKAVTDVQALWLEGPYSAGVDTVFVGADCIMVRDLRGVLADCDLAVAFMKGHKKWRLNTGFIYVHAHARERAATILRTVATDCRPKMCDDMAALERALSPMPPDFGVHERAGLRINFVDADVWNFPPLRADNPATGAYVLHFYGERSKVNFFEWAKRHGF